MCGIAGIVEPGKVVEERDMAAMLARLAHRGPDGEGSVFRPGVALGHRRLAIIDPSGGAQPMANPDSSLWITYNGELYNFKELREELVDLGYRFASSSDTEVILHAYSEWGTDCVSRFRGMFAFGILDLRDRRVFLARDHFGIKPLVYLITNGRLAFASEIQALRALPDCPLDIDLGALDQYLFLQYVPAPRTGFQNIRKLPPGHTLVVSLDEIGHPEATSYWHPDLETRAADAGLDWEEELDQTLRESVRAHLVSDVPFGAFLSGGLDSSAIVAYMGQLLPEPVKTFTIGFDEQQFDETPFADAVSARWGTTHRVDKVHPDALGVLPQLVQHYGEPFGDSSAVPTYYVAQAARRTVPMVLSGDGGDELFGGYQTYAAWLAYLNDPPKCPNRWREWFRTLGRQVLPTRYPPSQGFGRGAINWLQFVQYFPAWYRNLLWRPRYRSAVADVQEAHISEFEARLGPLSGLRLAQSWDLHNYLPSDLLSKVDIASMIHGLEVRTPLIDLRVFNFARQVPDNLKVVRSSSNNWTTKALLKSVMLRYYDRALVERKKMGFAMPVEHWFQGETGERVRHRLLERTSPLRELFCDRLLAKFVRKGGAGQVWLLLVLDEWLRQQ